MIGWINIYRAGHFHREGKPETFDRHGGDIYPSRKAALDHVHPFSHWIDCVMIEWGEAYGIKPNPADSEPKPLHRRRDGAWITAKGTDPVEKKHA